MNQVNQYIISDKILFEVGGGGGFLNLSYETPHELTLP